MSVECERLGGINLSQGVCDLPVPEVVAKAAAGAIGDGRNSYSRHDGTAALREALAAKYERLLGRPIDPERHVVVSAGATGALYCACLSLLEPGDEVILFEPYYSYHESTLIAAQARPVFIATEPPAWTFTREALDAALSPRTRAIIVNTPSNPSGKVWTRDELDVVAAFAREHDLFVFTDEIYEHFVYGEAPHIAAAALHDMWDRTITISGLSKTFSITGWRIGYAVCDQRWATAIANFNDLIYVCAPTPLQHGAAAGVTALGDEFLAALSAKYRRKRERLCDALDACGLTPCVPDGAYYVLADVAKIPGDTSRDRAMYILEHAGVASVPGAEFFKARTGDTLVRFCFAKEDDVLAEACRRLEGLR